MPSFHVATILAYEIKTGGFRGIYRSTPSAVSGTIEEVKSDVLPTIEAARYFAKMAGFERHPSASVAVLGRSNASSYRANLWEA